jgi:hypothetical protein
MNYLDFGEGGKLAEFEPVDELAPPHMPIHGVIRINFHVIRQRAFNKAYGRKADEPKISSDCMAVVDALLNMQLLGEETNATNLKRRVALILEKKTLAPALDAIKEALGEDMIAFKMRGATKIFGFTPAQKARSEAVSRYMQPIPQIQIAQMGNLKDPAAGADLLPPDVYFNILEIYENYKKKGK